MSFEALKKEVLQEAQRESDSVTARFQEQLETIQERVTAKAREIEERILAQGEAEAERQSRHLHQEMELGARSAVLTAKQQELEKTQQLFREQLLEADTDAQKKLLEGLLALVPETEGTIVPGEHHRELLTDVLKKPYTLAKESIPSEGGFVFQSTDTEMDLTLGQLVAQLFRKERAGIARILFG